MENFSYASSYPNSVNSSPRSREIDLENSSWDEPFNTYKVKFMCSYGGRIHLRPHDNQLTYIGGDTKILAVDRNIKFLGFISKLSVLCDSLDVCFKYQLPGEDLDALISVTNDEDLDHMMVEHDRLHRSSGKPARLRVFIFPAITNPESVGSFGSDDSKGGRQWFVDSLNSVQINKHSEGFSPPSEAAEADKRSKNPDFLFGLEKGQPPSPPNLQDSPPVGPTVMVKNEIHAAAPVEQRLVGESPLSGMEVQRQMHEFQRMQITGHNENYYQQNAPPPPPQRAVHMAPAGQYWEERNESSPAGANNPQQQVYWIQTPSGLYQAPSVRPVTGQVSPAYYGVQGMVTETYREQQVYDPRIQQATPITNPASRIIGPNPSDMLGSWPAIAEGYDVPGKQMYYNQGVAFQPPAMNFVMPASRPVDLWLTAAGAAELNSVAKSSQMSKPA